MSKRREEKVLTNEEILKLKEVCESYNDQLLVFGLLYTAMRVDELVHMKKSWISIDNQTITIPKSEGTWHPKTIKGHISNRRIPILNNELLLLLKNFHELTLDAHGCWVRLNYLWKKTGFEGTISPHYLRHTCLTLMARDGYTVYAISQMAGHKNTSTTLDVYINKDSIDLIKEATKRGGI